MIRKKKKKKKKRIQIKWIKILVMIKRIKEMQIDEKKHETYILVDGKNIKNIK